MPDKCDNPSPVKPLRLTNMRHHHGSGKSLLNGQFGLRCVRDVGSGYAGTVYQCVMAGTPGSDGTPSVHAAKVMSKRRIKAEAAVSEARLLKRARGPNVIEYRTCVECWDSYVLVTEYCAKGDLHGMLKHLDKADVMVRDYMRGVASGLARLHEKFIAHCDIKMRNILISENNVAKIADFGFAMQMRYRGERISVCQGTKDYWAPEMWRSSPFFCPFKADIYALGVTFLGVCEKRPLKRKDDDIRNIVHKLRDAQKKLVFKGLLYPKPEERFSLLEVMQTPWMTATLTPPPSP